MAKSALIDDLEKQFAENPRRVFARLANEYRKAGELETAIEICRAHVPLQPTYISGYIVLGQALFESGHLEDAHATFETALGLDPENLIALRQLGDIARERGDVTAARGWYRRLLEVDPQNDEVTALVEELATASEGQPAQGTAAEPAPITWGDINPEQPAVTPPSLVVPAIPAPAAPPPPAMAAPKPAPPAPPPLPPLPGLENLPPLPPIETVDLADFQAVAREPVPPPSPSRDAEPVDHVPSLEGFDFESLSNFGIESFSAGRSDDSRIERADELFSPDAANAGQPIPGLELEGLERGGYFTGPPSVSGAAEEHTTAHDAGGMEGVEPVDVGASAPSGAEPSAHWDASGVDVPASPMIELPADEPVAEPAPAAFVTETMAELYLRQGHREAALEIYRQLVTQRPHDGQLLERVAQLERADALGAPERTVRAFFARLALRQPPRSTPPSPPAAAAPDAAPDATAVPDVVGPEPARPEAAVAQGATEEPAVLPEATVPEAAGASEPAAGGTPVEIFAGEAPPPETSAGALEPELLDIEAFAHAPAVERDIRHEVLAGIELEMPPGEAPSPADIPPERSEAERLFDEPAQIAQEMFAAPSAPAVEETPSVAEAAPAPPVPPASEGVDTIFSPAAPASAEDELAAASLAGAFAPEMAPVPRTGAVGGRPARAAADPLSLDTVFREERAATGQRPQSSLSFDEFFAGAEGGAAATEGSDETRAGGGAPPDRDLELFQAWLEGLKK